MFAPKAAFSGFSVDDLAKAKVFYTDTLGLKLDYDEMGFDCYYLVAVPCSCMTSRATSRPRSLF